MSARRIDRQPLDAIAPNVMFSAISPFVVDRVEAPGADDFLLGRTRLCETSSRQRQTKSGHCRCQHNVASIHVALPCSPQKRLGTYPPPFQTSPASGKASPSDFFGGVGP